MASPPPPGIYVPVPTFFSKPSSNEPTPPLDLATQTKHALHLAKNGIRGLVLLGSTGEAIALTEDDRRSLITHIRQEMNGAGYKDYPLIAGTATQGVGDTVKLLQLSKEAGAQWGLVLAPGFFATCITQQGLIDCQLASSTVHSMSHDKFATFTGLGQQLLPVLMVGGAGAIDGLAAIFPRTVVKLYEFVKACEWEQARKLQEVVARGEGLVVGHGVVGAKEGLRRILGFESECRLPLKAGMSEDVWRDWEEVMGELGEAEKT
ncbi:MAG: hypothetical protein Q9210_002347 [Variospora velana]